MLAVWLEQVHEHKASPCLHVSGITYAHSQGRCEDYTRYLVKSTLPNVYGEALQLLWLLFVQLKGNKKQKVPLKNKIQEVGGWKG